MQKKLIKKLDGAKITDNIFDSFRHNFLTKPKDQNITYESQRQAISRNPAKEIGFDVPTP